MSTTKIQSHLFSMLDPSRFKMNKTYFFIFLREYKEQETRLFYAANLRRISAVLKFV